MKAQILIVDDELDIREALARHYRLKGYQVILVGGCDEALQRLREVPVQIVISDIMMPGRKGTELLPILHDQYPMVRAIMITGFVTLTNGLECMQGGADTCVFKPLGDLAELDEAVERAYQWHVRWQEKLRILQNNVARGDGS